MKFWNNEGQELEEKEGIECDLGSQIRVPVKPSRQKQTPSRSSSRWEYHWNKARFGVGEVTP